MPRSLKLFIDFNDRFPDFIQRTQAFHRAWDMRSVWHGRHKGTWMILAEQEEKVHWCEFQSDIQAAEDGAGIGEKFGF